MNPSCEGEHLEPREATHVVTVEGSNSGSLGTFACRECATEARADASLRVWDLVAEL